ncbi:MAG: hypothetical protein ABEK84_04925 [Salinibacter sp.]
MVWARPGPGAEAQGQWTAALARGLGRDVTLIDVVEAPRAVDADDEAELHDRLQHRMNVLQRRSEADFAEIPTDLQVHLALKAENDLVESAIPDRRDLAVLWAPVREHLIRRLLRKGIGTVLVLRCSRHRSALPWTIGVAEGDTAALLLANALIEGSPEEASLDIRPILDPDTLDDVPTSVVCASRPTPGWWRSRVLRRRREPPTSKRAILEVYTGNDRTA